MQTKTSQNVDPETIKSKMRFKKRRVCALSIVTLVFIFSLAFRLTFDKVVNAVIEMELKEKLPLRKGSMAFNYWVTPTVAIDFGIFVFDIVNPEEVLSGKAVPALIEKGPYVYKLYLNKTAIQYHSENNTVEYRQVHKFVFDRQASVGWDTDTFTTVNIPFLTVANFLQYKPTWLQTMVHAYFRSQNEAAFMQRSVRDIWWGYDDPVLQQASAIARVFNISTPVLTGKFGFFMDRNNTDDGVFKIFSGWNHNFNDFATVDRWNGMSSQSAWKSDFANRIEGSADGSMQPPMITKYSNLSLFDTNLKRTLKLDFNMSTTYRGVDVLRFHVPYSEFAAATENPDNAGYCTPDTDHCPPSGAINMSAVSYTAPLYASLPHFLGGDPFYQRQVKGLTPSQTKHQPFYDYHPITGVALNAARRYQLNIKTKSYQGFEAFQKMPDAYVPVLWIDGVAIIDKATLSLFRSQLQEPMDALLYLKIVLVLSSCLALLTAMLLLFCWRRKDQSKSKIQPREDVYGEKSNLIRGIQDGSKTPWLYAVPMNCEEPGPS